MAFRCGVTPKDLSVKMQEKQKETIKLRYFCVYYKKLKNNK